MYETVNTTAYQCWFTSVQL